MSEKEPELDEQTLELNEKILYAINQDCHSYKEISDRIGYSTSQIENAIKSYFKSTYAVIRLENGIEKVYPTEEAIHTFNDFEFFRKVDSDEKIIPEDIPASQITPYQKRVLMLLLNTDEHHPLRLMPYYSHLNQGLELSWEERRGNMLLLEMSYYITDLGLDNLYITERGKELLRQLNP